MEYKVAADDNDGTDKKAERTTRLILSLKLSLLKHNFDLKVNTYLHCNFIQQQQQDRSMQTSVCVCEPATTALQLVLINPTGKFDHQEAAEFVTHRCVRVEIVKK